MSWGKEAGLGVNPGPQLTSNVTLGKPYNLSKFQFLTGQYMNIFGLRAVPRI